VACFLIVNGMLTASLVNVIVREAADLLPGARSRFPAKDSEEHGGRPCRQQGQALSYFDRS